MAEREEKNPHLAEIKGGNNEIGKKGKLAKTKVT